MGVVGRSSFFFLFFHAGGGVGVRIFLYDIYVDGYLVGTVLLFRRKKK